MSSSSAAAAAAAAVGNSINKYNSGYKGYLYKKLFKNWKRFYVVLEKSNLIFYTDNTLSEISPYLFEIKSNFTKICDLNDYPIDDKSYLFYIQDLTITDKKELDKSVFLLSASNALEKREWLEAINDAMHGGCSRIRQVDLCDHEIQLMKNINVSYSTRSPFETHNIENQSILRATGIVEFPPIVTFPVSNQSEHFTLIMLDIDAVRTIDITNANGAVDLNSSLHNEDERVQSTNSRNRSIYLLWCVTNILKGDIKNGNQLVTYESPAPEYNTGYHRYVLLLFKQEKIVKLESKQRENFPYLSWIKKNKFADPVGIYGFYAVWDDTCDRLHAQLKYTPVDSYCSHRQIEQVKSKVKINMIQRIHDEKVTLYQDFILKDTFHDDFDISSVNVASGIHSIELKVAYKSDTTQPNYAYNGVYLSPKQVLHCPVVSYDILLTESDNLLYVKKYGTTASSLESKGELFTLMLVDIDYQDDMNKKCEYVHWLVVNIPGNNVNKGTVVLPYVPPQPSFSSGLHRYVFLLYHQYTSISTSQIDVSKKLFKGRSGKRQFEFIQTYSPKIFSTIPVGLELFLCRWDDTVDQIHKSLSVEPNTRYKSPSQLMKLLHDSNIKPEVKQQRSTNFSNFVLCEYDHVSILEKIQEKSRIFEQYIAEGVAYHHHHPHHHHDSSSEENKTNFLTDNYLQEYASGLFKSSSDDNQNMTLEDSSPASHHVRFKSTADVKNLNTNTSISNSASNKSFNSASGLKSANSSFYSLSPSTAPAAGSRGTLHYSSKSHSSTSKKSKDYDAGDGQIKSPTSSLGNDDDDDDDDEDNDFLTKADDLIVRSNKDDSLIEMLADTSPKSSASSHYSEIIYDNIESVLQSETASTPNFDTGPRKIIFAGDTPEMMKDMTPNAASTPPLTLIHTSSQSQLLTAADKKLNKSGATATAAPPVYEPARSVAGKSFFEMFSGKIRACKDADAVCNFFNVKTKFIFTGEKMRAQFTSEVSSKETILWVDPLMCTLHWNKTRDVSTSSFLVICDTNLNPEGTYLGHIENVEGNGVNIEIFLVSGETLNLKVSLEGAPTGNIRAFEWISVIKVMLKRS